MTDDLYTALLCRLPSNDLAERALAGALLFGAPDIAVVAARRTRMEDYHDWQAALIIRTALTLHSQGLTPDPISVKAALERTSAPQPPGTWAMTIIDCLHACTIPSAAPAWADVIIATAGRRSRILDAIGIIQRELTGDP